MKRLIKISILVLLYAFYKVAGLFYREKGTAVLMYHSIGSKKGPLTVFPENLEKQLKYLKDKQKRFLITFDDGYRDLKTIVWPILKKFNIPAVVFVHTGRSSENLGNNFPMLNWDEIRELEKNGLIIGNHSHQHLDMKKLSEEELRREVILSEEIFRQELGWIPKIFAYPGGKYNQQIIEFLRQRGYQRAFTIDEGLWRPEDNSFRIKRIGISRNTNMFEFKIMLTPAFHWYQAFRKIKPAIFCDREKWQV